MQDSAPSHSAKSIIDLTKKKKGFKLKEQTPSFLDINPIKNL